jgi:Xaa-Pro dipeptidase
MKSMVDDDTLFTAHLRYVMDAIGGALRELGMDALVIASGSTRMVFQDDQAYPLRLNPWYRWPAPAPAAPDSFFIIRNNELPHLVLFTPRDYWHAPATIPQDSWTRHVRITACDEPRDAMQHLDALQGEIAWLGESSPPHSSWRINPVPLLSRLEQFRCRKTPYELARMANASLRGALGHLAAERAFRQGSAELDIHLAFLGASRQDEADLPYHSIVALNEHAATLHYQLRDASPPARRHSLLVDAGASDAGYASDITRTWAAAPGEFSLLIDGVELLQQRLCARVRAGADWRDLHLQAQHEIAALLRDIGVLRMDASEAVDCGVSATFMPHGLGHLLGLQVHDVGGLHSSAETAPIPRPEGHPALRLTRRLEAGMVVTVEPGLYFIDSLLQRLRAGAHSAQVDWLLVDKLRCFGGIRIEDNVAVTAAGGENLTRAAFAAAG